jgi:hypothetical protein
MYAKDAQETSQLYICTYKEVFTYRKVVILKHKKIVNLNLGSEQI